MPATPLLIRSSTSCTSPASSALDAGPVYRQVYSDFGFSLFHCAQPSPSTVKNGLSRPFTTTASVFFWAIAGPAATQCDERRADDHENRLFHFVSFGWKMAGAGLSCHGWLAGGARPGSRKVGSGEIKNCVAQPIEARGCVSRTLQVRTTGWDIVMSGVALEGKERACRRTFRRHSSISKPNSGCFPMPRINNSTRTMKSLRTAAPAESLILARDHPRHPPPPDASAPSTPSGLVGAYPRRATPRAARQVFGGRTPRRPNSLKLARWRRCNRPTRRRWTTLGASPELDIKALDDLVHDSPT